MRKFAVAILLAGSMLAFAQSKETPRRIDFTQVMVDLDNQPILRSLEPKQALTLGYVASSSLYVLLPSEQQLKGVEKKEFNDRVDKLARKVYRCKSCVLTADEITLIEEHVRFNYQSPLIEVQARDLLDPAEAAK